MESKIVRNGTNGKPKRKHIDDVQTATVDEHLRILMDDEEVIDSDAPDLTSEDLPEWYDDKLFKAGQKYYNRNSLGMSTASLTGLVAVLAIPSILKVLMFTKQSSSSCSAFRRYLETLLHTHVFYNPDVKDDSSKWYKSLATVRWKHCTSSKRSIQGGAGGITHRDMALTQFGFIGYSLLEPETLGLTNEPEEREGINHFWRVLGHMLGISDSLNICRKTESETTQLCKRLQTEVFGKYMEEVPPNFLDMTTAMLEGLWAVDFSIDVEATMAFTYHLNGLEYHEPLGWYSWLNLKYHEIIFFLCGTPYIGTVIRVYFNNFIQMNKWIVERWPLLAWWRFGKEQSKINLYPKLKGF